MSCNESSTGSASSPSNWSGRRQFGRHLRLWYGATHRHLERHDVGFGRRVDHPREQLERRRLTTGSLQPCARQSRVERHAGRALAVGTFTSTVFSEPGVDNGIVYVGTKDGTLLAFGALPIPTPALSGSNVNFASAVVSQSTGGTATFTATAPTTVTSFEEAGSAFTIRQFNPSAPCLSFNWPVHFGARSPSRPQLSVTTQVNSLLTTPAPLRRSPWTAKE
jgi:hypothetical protein